MAKQDWKTEHNGVSRFKEHAKNLPEGRNENLRRSENEGNCRVRSQESLRNRINKF